MARSVELAIDPIGDFLESQARLGADASALEGDRQRIERFRRMFPGVPLPALTSRELERHLTKLASSGASVQEVETSRRVCRDFLDYSSSRASHGAGMIHALDAAGGRFVAPALLVGGGVVPPPVHEVQRPNVLRAIGIALLMAAIAALVGAIVLEWVLDRPDAPLEDSP